jgi:toxin ParE1/3/4
VRLTATAEADFRDIIAWTLEEFGDRPARIYADVLSAALAALITGPTTAGAKERREIAKGLFTLHVARNGRKSRHFVLFRVRANARQVEALRLLHDAMDLRFADWDQRAEPSMDSAGGCRLRASDPGCDLGAGGGAQGLIAGC